MRSIHFNEEHEMFRRSVREFLQTEVAPQADHWERARSIPGSIWKRMGELGFLGITFPEEYGGTGADIFFAIAFLEELPRSLMGGFTAAVTVQQFIATGAILRRGSEELKQRYLVPSITGDKVGAISISEPDTGSDVASIRTRAVRDGDQWVIDGAKMWITNGVQCDFNVVACRTDSDAGAAGISLIVVDRGTPGITATPIDKIGWHCSDTAEISFESVRVPAGNLVGQENQGFSLIMETFVLERLVVAATAVGACVVALEETLGYMTRREAFGRPIGKFQALRHRIADLFAELEAVRQLVYHTAWLYSQGVNAVKEAAMAKMLATELNKRVADECLQFHGGFGYTDEFLVSRFFRDARVSTIVAGTTEIMREIIARSVIDGAEVSGAGERVVSDAEARSEGPVRKPGSVASPVVESQPAAPQPRPELPAAPLAPPASTTTPPVNPRSVHDLFRSLPFRFRPDKVEGWTARFHFHLRDANRPLWTVSIHDGLCEVIEGAHGTPDCVVTTNEETYIAVETGKRDAQMAFMTGGIKVSNVGAMMKFSKAFRRLA